MNSDFIFNGYTKIFARPNFIKFNKFLFNLSLRGMGILNYKTNSSSGELHFLKYCIEGNNNLGIVFDIGANTGNYSKLVNEFNPMLTVYSFEPNPKTFKELDKNSKKHSFKPLNIGMSDKVGKMQLYDYVSRSGSSHASIYKEVFDHIHKEKRLKYNIDVYTIDHFCKEKGIEQISLLKIDTEGHEFRVLQGAKKMLDEQRIHTIHFEFNEMNIFSRTFLSDFIKLLPGFSFFRMLPNGLTPIDNYRPCHLEIFAYQNIVAIKDE